MTDSRLPAILRRYQSDLLGDWIKEQTAPGVMRSSW